MGQALMRVLFVVILLLIVGVGAYFFVRQSNITLPFTEGTPIGGTPAPSIEVEQEQGDFTTSIFLVQLEISDDNTVSCKDELVGVVKNINTNLELRDQLWSLYLEMLNFDDKVIEEKLLYNPLYESKLDLESIEVKGTEVTVDFTGEEPSDKICGSNRALDQLKAIALQYPQVETVRIFINGEQV